jgi:hypothetical protein
MPSRQRGIGGFIAAFDEYVPDFEVLRRFDRPVYFALGGRSTRTVITGIGGTNRNTEVRRCDMVPTGNGWFVHCRARNHRTSVLVGARGVAATLYG